jgi:putative transposase
MPPRCQATAAVHPINGRLRDELLNKTLFSSLPHARTMLTLWRADYNTSRPHSQLGWRTPTEYAAAFKPRRALALRSIKGSAPTPVAYPAQKGNPNAGNELTSG